MLDGFHISIFRLTFCCHRLCFERLNPWVFLFLFLFGQVNIETKVVVGDPKEKICEVVENLHADLLVMGSRAFGPIKRYGFIAFQ